MDLAVSEVAQLLGVSRQRVLTLIAQGEVPARRVGGRWVLESADIEARGRDRADGRPMAPRVAWGLIALAEGRDPHWLPREQRSRLRSRLRLGPSLEQVAAWTRRRNRVLWLRGHPAALPRLLATAGALPTGASAGGHDLVDPGRVEIYLPDDQANPVMAELAFRPAARSSANAIVKIPQGLWPFDQEPGPTTVALDLWEAGDERSRSSARRLYRNALASNRSSQGTTP
jgi:excisionase family DNA binding protein